MQRAWILIAATVVGGCASQPHVTKIAPAGPAEPLVREAPATKVVETRYEVRSYRDAERPGVRHAAHAIYRSTRVPAQLDALETVPRTAFAPMTHAPLPPSAELSAELSAQRALTADLQALQQRMAAIEHQAKAQYGSLVAQTDETVKLRRQLEAERSRIQEMEAKLGRQPATPVQTIPAATALAETKW